MRVFKREWAKSLPVISYKAGERTWCFKHLRTGNDPCSRRREQFPPYVTPSRLAGATISLDYEINFISLYTSFYSCYLAV